MNPSKTFLKRAIFRCSTCKGKVTQIPLEVVIRNSSTESYVNTYVQVLCQLNNTCFTSTKHKVVII